MCVPTLQRGNEGMLKHNLRHAITMSYIPVPMHEGFPTPSTAAEGLSAEFLGR